MLARGRGSELATLERWTDRAALDAHAQSTGRHTPFRPELRAGNTEREDYVYYRTR
jgi:quinol monooxygenase YgiN